ncbi:MAG: PEP-CTERM sorting domain-containing protein [Okeania sp. SIO2D1]|nr:PEP-CTERM sorting domain-containing protein [Okeania sp. SIO2D1]
MNNQLQKKKIFNFLRSMTVKSLASAAAVAASVTLAGAAEAASFNFSYTLESGDVLAGMLEGDIQADGDTVFVSAITMPTFNGVAGPDLNFVESWIELLLGADGSPTVSFSGLVMDIFACDTLDCSGDPDGFAFESTGSLVGFPAYGGGESYGGVSELYNSDNWELTAKNLESTPEPASVLGLLAFGAVGGSMLKRK